MLAAVTRRVGAVRGDGDKPSRMLVLPCLSRAASYGSSPDSSCTSSELRPATTGSPGGRLCNSRTLAPTCRQHGVLQLISTYYDERENDGAYEP